MEIPTDKLSAWFRFLPKPIAFSLIGAVAALSGALIFEPWMGLARLGGEKAPPMAIATVLDTSSSMSGAKLAEVKTAAADFVQRQDLSQNDLSVIGFSSSAEMTAPLSNDSAILLAGIAGLTEGGGTNMSAGVATARAALKSTSKAQAMLLFTDGHPNERPSTLREAKAFRAAGGILVAVATPDADSQFLTQVTGDSGLVFSAAQGNFGSAFEQAERAFVGSLIERNTVAGGYASWLLTLGWTVSVAAAVATALSIGQALLMNRLQLTWKPHRRALIGGLLAGAISGLCGQVMFVALAGGAVAGPLVSALFWIIAGLVGTLAVYRIQRRLKSRYLGRTIPLVWLIVGGVIVGLITSAFVPVAFVGRLFAWILLGALLGLGLSRVVPNLSKNKAMLGGLVGGAAGMIGFLLLSGALADAPGRIIGAAALGASIAFTVAVAEAAFRQAALEIDWGSSNGKTQVNLGPQPIRIGSNLDCDVYLKRASPVDSEIYLREGNILRRDSESGRESTLRNGDTLRVGGVGIRVMADAA